MSDDHARKLILIDGSGYIFRAYHALPPLSRADGTPVGAVVGFCNMLHKLMETLDGDYLAVIFDKGRVTFRNEIYPDYKANRAETPEDLIPQFPLVREAARAFNLPVIELQGYEADDLIASYAKAASADGLQTVIVSSDKDLMQLMDAQIALYDPIKQKEMTFADVEKKFGVTPDKVVEVQALMGDATDNIPGVPGIGPKTAAQLIQEYGDLESLLARASEIKQNKRRESLIEFADQARLSYELVLLKDDVALPEPITGFKRTAPDPETLLSFLQENNFKQLLARMETKLGVKAPAPPPPDVAQDENASSGDTTLTDFSNVSYSLVQTKDALAQWIDKARAKGIAAIDTETTGLDAMQAELVGISLCVEPGEACYIPLQHTSLLRGDAGASTKQPSHIALDRVANTRESEQTDLFAEPSQPQLVEGQLDLRETLETLKPVLTDPAILKVGQNIKYDLLVLKKYDVDITPVDDSMLLSYVTSAGLHAHNMDELSQRHLHHTPIAYKEVCGSGRSQISFAEVGLDAARDYAAEDADITLRLRQWLKPKMIAEHVTTTYECFERPLIPVLVAMEQAGITVDPAFLKTLSGEFAGQMAELEKDIYQLAGHEFNIGSPKQLGEILFEEMGLEGGKKSSKTGAYSTGAEVLEELAAKGHLLPEQVLKWRGLSKLKSTYTDALLTQINPETGRVHTAYSMAATTTGRLASSDPNLQNIPIRTEEGRRIREAFIAAKGCKLIAADYSQIELRLLAHMAEIDTLKQAFKDGADIHAITASQMFGVPVDAVDGELRRKAKTINFGIIYGISAHGLATRLGIGRGEAAEYINAYFEQYPGIRRYMERTKEFAREHGYVTTLYGRKVHVKDIHAKNPNLRAFSERAAINAPLQGTAADIIKRAMIDVHAALAEHYPKATLLLQVHDELIVEAPDTEAEQVGTLVQNIMTQAAHLSVPLTVEIGIGDNWAVIH